MLAAALLAFSRQPLRWLDERFPPPTMVAYWLGLLRVVAGLTFAVSARIHLGRNWSGTVTGEQDHELIRTGRGLLSAILGTAIAFGEWRGFRLRIVDLRAVA